MPGDAAISEVSVDDCRAVFRLVHELCELGNDPIQWNTRLLQGLEPLIRSDHGIADIFSRDLDPASIDFKLYLDHNLDESWSQYLDLKGVSEQPHTPAMMARLGTDFTVSRQEVIDDAAWYASDYYRDVARKVDWDQAIFSQVFIASRGLVHGLGMLRRAGRRTAVRPARSRDHAIASRGARAPLGASPTRWSSTPCPPGYAKRSPACAADSAARRSPTNCKSARTPCTRTSVNCSRSSA